MILLEADIDGPEGDNMDHIVHNDYIVLALDMAL